MLSWVIFANVGQTNTRFKHLIRSRIVSLLLLVVKEKWSAHQFCGSLSDVGFRVVYSFLFLVRHGEKIENMSFCALYKSEIILSGYIILYVRNIVSFNFLIIFNKKEYLTFLDTCHLPNTVLCFTALSHLMLTIAIWGR